MVRTNDEFFDARFFHWVCGCGFLVGLWDTVSYFPDNIDGNTNHFVLNKSSVDRAYLCVSVFRISCCGSNSIFGTVYSSQNAESSTS